MRAKKAEQFYKTEIANHINILKYYQNKFHQHLCL